MSKLMMFDFECDQGHQFEDLVQPDVRSLPCPTCSGKAKRLASLGHLDWRHMGLDPGFPSAAEKWAKAQEQKARTDKGGRADGAPNLKMY